MKMPVPRLYLGTMTFGWSQTSSRVDESVALEMVQHFVRHNHNHLTFHQNNNNSNNNSNNNTNNSETPTMVHCIDTARIYAGGKTEAIVGAVLPKAAAAAAATAATAGDNNTAPLFSIGTKAHPSQPGGLSPQGIETQLQASLQAMNLTNPSATTATTTTATTTLSEYYLHQPDPDHSLRESLRYLHSLVEQGVIQRIGMSNYHVSEMERAFAICREEQITPPTVYQGLYNPLNRLVEEDGLFPLLQQHNCSFVAYNPLAAGLLTGQHTSRIPDAKAVPKGRFQNNPNYLPRFYTDENFRAMELIRQACQEHEISMVEATYRWLLCHSALTGNDGVLIGASSVAQLDQNLQACAVAAAASDGGQQPLPESILQAFAQAWEITKAAGCFPYWRSYSADMPNRESLDAGASYQAKGYK